MADDWTIAPCGCGFGRIGDVFVIEPCDLRCELYLWTLDEIERQGVPRETWDLS